MERRFSINRREKEIIVFGTFAWAVLQGSL
jgi:hypothetical protein